MVAKNVIAKRYAKALLDAAASADSVSEVLNDLNSLAAALSNDSKKLRVLTSIVMPLEAKLRYWNFIFKMKMNKISKNFIQILIHNNRLDAILECIHIFEELVHKSQNIIPVKVITAQELSADSLELLSKHIEQSIQSKIDVSTVVDKNILGGLIINVGNKMLDMSIKSRLAQVKNYIKNLTA